MLILNVDWDVDYIQIGDDIKIYHKAFPGKYLPKFKVGIDAPKHVKIVRSNAINKDKVEK